MLNPVSLEAFAAWLEMQQAETEYCYGSVSDCLAARYFRSTGLEYSCAYIRSGRSNPRIQIEKVACSGPHNYGAALDRARAMLHEARTGPERQE